MHRRILLILAPLLLLAACGSTTTTDNSQSSSTSSRPAMQTAAQTAASLVGAKIQQSTLWPYAFLISEGTSDPKTQQALTGFTLSSAKSSDGSTTFTLHATKPEYKDQTYTLQPGQKLYFIERFLPDDANGQEKNILDDAGVITENDGTIVAQ